MRELQDVDRLRELNSTTVKAVAATASRLVPAGDR